MVLKKQNKKVIPELRQDLVSGDWVLIAPARAIRPEILRRERREKIFLPKTKCPFENPSKYGNQPPLLVYQNKANSDWFLQVIPNKYPAVECNLRDFVKKIGPYQMRAGTGFHEVVVLRDHDKHISQYSDEAIQKLFLAYQDRFKSLARKKFVEYISIFHNYGKEAGASIPHPHSQILALSVVPPDIGRSFNGSRNYFHRYGKCIHCLMIEYELEAKKRIIFENKSAVVFAPYASHSNFETRIFPKKHESSFERISQDELLDIAEAFLVALKKIRKNLGDPSFNFFLHTAPSLEKTNFNHYHWHFEILPKTTIFGGFDIGTGIDILTVAPEEAAKILRR